MAYFLILFSCVWLYKLLSNISYLIRISFYNHRYNEFLKKQDYNFSVYTASVVPLFKQAGIREYTIPYVLPAGDGFVSTGHALIFENISNTREDVVQGMLSCFSVAKGTFKHRILEAMSPLYWINCILFLPRKIYEYIGIDAGKISCKLLQLIYWILTPLLIALRADLYQYIAKFFSQL